MTPNFKFGFAALLVAVAPVYAAPPPPDSEDYQVLSPYSRWLESQKQPTLGSSCCNLSDGRLVDVRTGPGGGYEVKLIHPETLPDAPKSWLPVRESAILHGQNPTGYAIAWIVGNAVYCFMPATGT